ncbi:hypothetical protein SAMN05216238_10343 [Lentibacillus persicus]|uniref:Uncharacterized protein n=1 Tax=Lentibacillus persicus TaxID=640948 RepID=A0A1I1U657_9BACI|nr:hypothetical protein [Lentibacillus persicus]SFD66259.1 hypothetical protein SAMN05216238_10343 [Lentibacillus persicus]
MSEELQNVFDTVQEKLGLTNHKLERHHFFREKNHFNETIYLVSMEWFSDDSEEAENGYNPAGTAVVDINFHTSAIRRIVFVNGANSADHTLYPNAATKEDVIDWIEDITGLTFGRQFLIAEEQDYKMAFRAAVDNIPVSPSGFINVEFNDDGVLTLFSIDGEFPNEAQIEWEPFALTPDKYEPVAKKQCHLLTFPDQEAKKWKPIYGMEEVFLTNDAARTIPMTLGDGRSSFIARDKVLAWEAPLEGRFEQKEIDFSPEVTFETVRANQPHPDTLSLTEDEVTASEDEVLRFMRLVYPNENGKRRLTGLYLKDGYIAAEIKPAQDEWKNALDIKIKLLIERDTLTAVNYFDQDRLFEAFSHFGEAEEAVVAHEDAFNKLLGYLKVEPVYVYDSKRGKYIMCGKLDCDYGVNAVTGEVVKLNEMF